MLNFRTIFENFYKKGIPTSIILEEVEPDSREEEMISNAQERREKGSWGEKYQYSGSLAATAQALYNYLVENGEINPEDKDIYDIIPLGGDPLYQFTTSDFEDVYWVGDENTTQDTAEDMVKDLIEDIGLSDSFSEGFVEQYIDLRRYNRWVREFFDEDAYAEPEAYLDDEDRLPDEKQEQYLQFYRLKLEKLISLQNDGNDSEETENEIEKTEEKIQYILDNPKGKYDDSKLEDAIEQMYSAYKDDPESFWSNYYGDDYKDWLINLNFIDMDDLVQGVIDSDGFGNTINSYNGEVDEQRLDNETYYIFPQGPYTGY